MSSHGRPSGEMQDLEGPGSELPWSSDFVMQSIKILPVALSNGGLLSLRPDHADSFQVGWPPKAKPEEIAAKAIEHLGLRPIVVHSTSWRHQDDAVILTYLTIVSTDYQFPAYWEMVPIVRAELARGDSLGPPGAIDVFQVLEHGLRHLAWLLGEDQAI